MQKSIVSACAGVAMGLALSTGDAIAADGSGGGSVSYVAVWSQATELANGDRLVQSNNKGIILADSDAVPFHLAGQDCANTWVFGSDGAALSASGHCVAVDRDGDTWSLVWQMAGPAGSSWTIIDGTGKYAGMTGGGTTENLVALPDGRSSINWQGTWTLK